MRTTERTDATATVESNDAKRARDSTADRSRRSVLKAGALTAGGLALGAASTGTAAAQEADNLLVYSYGFYPGVPFRVVDQLPASITVNLLRLPNGDRVPEISQPSDYTGYVIRYDMAGQRSAITALVFTRGALRSGQGYRLGETAQVFSSDLNLLGASVNRQGGN